VDRSFAPGLACALVLALGCSGGEPPAVGNPPLAVTSSPQSTDCSDPRPEMCTRQYDPVCGLRRDGSTRTYGNACTACSDAEVVSHRPGACQ
jgi:hypothetical protein